MATRTSITSGLWSSPSTWDTGVPVDGDSAVIAHTVYYDVDMRDSGWVTGVTLTINAGGVLQVYEDSGINNYYFLTSSNIINNGEIRAGTSPDVPFEGNFEIDFNGSVSRVYCYNTGKVYLYCKQPIVKYVTLTSDESSGQTVLPVDVDLTGDIWKIGDEVFIADHYRGATGAINGEHAIVDDITATEITITSGLSADKNAGSLIALVTRNIRIGNVGNNGHMFYQLGANSYVAAEVYGFYTLYVFDTCSNGFEFAGTTNVKSASMYLSYFCIGMLMSGTVTGWNNSTSHYGAYNGENNVYTGNLISFGIVQIYGNKVLCTGLVFGTRYGFQNVVGLAVTSSAIFRGMYQTVNNTSPVYFYGKIELSIWGILGGSGHVVSGELDAIWGCLQQVGDTKCYNTLFEGSEFTVYADEDSRESFWYVESIDHDQVKNAYKSWTLGGIVTSQTLSPPTGYTQWFEHACESSDYPCFRQYEVTVLPGTAIEVSGMIRNADGVDLSSNPPKLEIIDRFADPLVDSSYEPLDTCEIPDPSGTDTSWQEVSVIWANQSDASKIVLVRMSAQHATADIDEVWSVANYQTQIQSIYDKLNDLVVEDSAGLRFTDLALQEAPVSDATLAKQDNILTVIVALLNLFEELTIDDSGGVRFTDEALQNAPGVDADTILDSIVEGSISLKQAIRLVLSVLTGKSSGGGGTTLTFRDVGDTKNRLQVTVDTNGNRIAVGTRDGS